MGARVVVIGLGEMFIKVLYNIKNNEKSGYLNPKHSKGILKK